jgi:hypothetical protein
LDDDAGLGHVLGARGRSAATWAAGPARTADVFRWGVVATRSPAGAGGSLVWCLVWCLVGCGHVNSSSPSKSVPYYEVVRRDGGGGGDFPPVSRSAG